jgi:hypothetical protein
MHKYGLQIIDINVWLKRKSTTHLMGISADHVEESISVLKAILLLHPT